MIWFYDKKPGDFIADCNALNKKQNTVKSVGLMAPVQCQTPMVESSFIYSPQAISVNIITDLVQEKLASGQVLVKVLSEAPQKGMPSWLSKISVWT